jgi:hypothetical protein
MGSSSAATNIHDERRIARMMETAEKAPGYEGWAIVELFGHKRMAGFVSSQEIAGGSLVRIDVPETTGSVTDGAPPTKAYTKLVGVAAIYGITPCEESVARLAARSIERWNDPIPVSLPALPAPASAASEVDVDDDEETDVDDDEREAELDRILPF